MTTSKRALAQRRCRPCRGGEPPLEAGEIKQLSDELDAWSVVDSHHLEKELRFPDFRSALAWIDEVGAIAEAEDHHPELWFTWGRARVRIWTHAIDGLTENDFILAAKIDGIGKDR